MGHSAAVLGASGFSGGEVVRLLASHPSLEVAILAAGDKAGEPIAAHQPHLAHLGGTFGDMDAAVAAEVDVLFACLPSGVLGSVLPRIAAHAVIDLSDEFRDAPGWTYGLPELARKDISGSRRIANPGCYPTAVLLATAPLARAGLIEGPVVVDALSGVSGAGRRTEDAYSLASLHGDVRAYGTTSHRHVPEMERGLSTLAGLEAVVSFTPHLVPLARGLLITARARMSTPSTEEGVLDVLRAAYRDETFVEVVDEWPSPKAVAGSNRARVTARVDARAGFVVVSCALDNLGKGAAGQAIQNANLVLGLPEDSGLGAVGVWP